MQKPLIIAHRGFSDEAPENSIAAFRAAVEAQCDMIELDVRLSSDDVPVVFHDKYLGRTSNGSGAVGTKDSLHLCSLDNGSWFSPKYHTERIPTLKQVLHELKKKKIINIEIKPDIFSRSGNSVIEIIMKIVEEERSYHRVIFTSFNHTFMKELKERYPQTRTGVIYNPISHFRKSPSRLIRTAGANIFVCSKYQINHDVVEDAHSANIDVYVYGVKTGRDVQRMLTLGIEGIICNNPKFVKETLSLLV